MLLGCGPQGEPEISTPFFAQTLPQGGFLNRTPGPEGLSKFKLCSPPHPVQLAVHLTHLGGAFLPVLSGHTRTEHCHLVSSTCLYLPPLPSSTVLSFRLPHPLAVCLAPKSAAPACPATPILASSVSTDGPVKSGWVPKALFDFCSPLVPRPYGATGEKGRGSGTFSPCSSPSPASPSGTFFVVFL